METANTDQPQIAAAEPITPYSAFRIAQNKLMHDFLGGLGDIETHLLEHERAAERKVEGLRFDLQEAGKEIVRLTTELSHRPPFPGWGHGLQDLGERPIDAPAIEGSIQAPAPAEQSAQDEHLAEELQAAGEHISRLEADLATERANVTRLEGELAAEKASTERLERDNRRLEEKIEHDQREVSSNEATRQAEVDGAAAEAARLLAEANADRARLAEEVSQLTGKVSEEQGLRGEAEAKAAQAAEEADVEKSLAKALQEELDALRDAPAPPPAEVDVAAVRAAADEDAKVRMATIVAAIEEANPGISLHQSLELFAAAWEAPRTEPEQVTDQEGPTEQPSAPGTADLFDFTLPPPSEDDEIPYVPHAEAVGSHS